MPRGIPKEKQEKKQLPMRIVVKDEEKRMFIIFERPPYNMEDLAANREYRDREASQALEAKADFEYANGVQLLNFHLDPIAGGQEPIKERGHMKTWYKINDDGSRTPAGQSMVYPMRSIPAWTGEWL